jgi:hypothetical protein
MQTSSRRRITVHSIEFYRIDEKTGEVERTEKTKKPRLKEGAKPVELSILDVDFNPTKHVLVNDPGFAQPEPEAGMDEDGGKADEGGEPTAPDEGADSDSDEPDEGESE